MGFYDEMQDTAKELITEFGNVCTLKKLNNHQKYNEITKKNEPVFTEYNGKCVMKPYTADAIGILSNIIEAGDVEFKCIFDTGVIATEMKDKIEFRGITYNILSVSIINPNGDKIIVQTLSARKAGK